MRGIMSKTTSIGVRFALLCASLLSCSAQGQNELGAMVDNALSPLVARHDVSGAVLIAHGDHTKMFRAYGLANREWQIPVSRDTRFLIGSISKSFTSAAILRLHDRGKLSLDQSIMAWFPAFPSAETITVRLLLEHRAGLSRDLPNIEKTRVQELTTAETVALIQSVPLLADPGTKTQYSNNGYRVLARIIELVSGMDYPDFVESEVIAAAGMTQSGVLRPQTGVPKLAVGYCPFPGVDQLGPAPSVSARSSWGPGAVFSTVDDLAKWSKALRGNAFLSEASRRAMLTANADGRSLGLGVTSLYGRLKAGHDGVYYGFNASFDIFLDDGLTIVYLGNIETGALSQVRSALLAIATGNPLDPPKPRLPRTGNLTIHPQEYAGDYEVFPGFNLTVRSRRDALLLGAGEGDFLLEPVARDTFEYRLKYAAVVFQRDGQGRVTGLTWREGEQAFNCRRIGEGSSPKK